MTRDELSTCLLELVTTVAPDVEPASIDPDLDFREQFDFDSMDTLNLAVAIQDRFGVDVPETDYARLAGLAKAVAYLASRVPRDSDASSKAPG